MRYRPKPVAAKKLKLESLIVTMSQKHSTLGYKKIAHKLREQRWAVNKKLVQRVRREEGLQVATKASSTPPRAFHRVAAAGRAQEPCLGLGFRERLHRTWRQAQNVQPDRRIHR